MKDGVGMDWSDFIDHVEQVAPGVGYGRPTYHLTGRSSVGWGAGVPSRGSW